MRLLVYRHQQMNIEEQIITDPVIRKAIGQRDFFWFFRIYFSEYISYPIAPYQREMLQIAQDKNITLAAVTAFRGSAKSTIYSLAYPIWSVLGDSRRRYVLIVCQTQQLAQQTLTNIKQELLVNQMIAKDYHLEKSQKLDEWNANTIVIPQYDARISAISIGESIRGLRHRQYRPDLIILDDIEDVTSSRTKEGRDKLWQFVNAELLPIGDTDTKIVFIGNLVHLDSVMMKLKRIILEKKDTSKVYREYPLLQNNKSLWEGKFPDKESVERLKSSIPNPIDYEREYMLHIAPEEGRIINFEDLKYYDEIDEQSNLRFYIITVDPAISEKETADNTAILVGKVYGSGDKFRLYIQPYLVNRRMGLPEMIQEMKQIIRGLGRVTMQIHIEGGPQKGLIQMLKNEGIAATEFSVQGSDKRTRLAMTSQWVKNGMVRFPKHGIDELINQIIFFGSTRHDDLADAFSMMIMQLLGEVEEMAPIIAFI